MERELVVKDWFVSKLKEVSNYNASRRIVSIIRETEKAYFVEMEYDRLDGESEISVEQWVPKSVVLEKEEADNQFEKAIESGLEYNKKLVEFAKESGIKGIRSGLRTATLIKKITDAGLVAPVRA